MQIVSSTDTPKPIRPYCQACGWRKGGPDSWDGVACKCRLTADPIRNVDTGALFFCAPNKENA